MTRTDPAEQRRILRRTVLATLRQHTASKPGAAPALAEAVWRIIGPALASRDRIIAELAAVAEPCTHTEPGTPCDWDTCRQPGRPAADQPPLTVKVFGMRPPCDSGRHDAHPGWDCDEQDALAKAWHKAFTDVRIKWEIPPRSPADLAPLRQLAARALGLPDSGVRRDPRADDPAYDGITGYRTWEQVLADPPQFTGVLSLLQAQASREADHAAAVEAAIARVEAEHGPDDTITIPYITTED